MTPDPATAQLRRELATEALADARELTTAQDGSKREIQLRAALIAQEEARSRADRLCAEMHVMAGQAREDADHMDDLRLQLELAHDPQSPPSRATARLQDARASASSAVLPGSSVSVSPPRDALGSLAAAGLATHWRHRIDSQPQVDTAARAGDGQFDAVLTPPALDAEAAVPSLDFRNVHREQQ